jgi:cytochrome d ubiquinol oxidase subunit I
MFIGFYVVLLITFAVFARKWLRQGPDLSAMPPECAPDGVARAVPGNTY